MLADEVASVQTVEEEQNDSIGIELSLRIGVRDLRKVDWLKPGPAVQFEATAPLSSSPFDIVLRGYWTNMDWDKDAYFDDGENTYTGGSAALQFNFARDSSVNPYVAAGIAYEREKVKGEGRWSYYDFETSGDGTAFVARGGLEFSAAPFFLVGECGWMTECYDDSDDAQVVLAGRVGYALTDSCRIDVGVDYYTEWKDIFFSAGLGFVL